MSLSYDLALRLRDSGFPYKPTRLHFDGSVETPPTLEEVIDACGDRFFSLVKDNGDYFCTGAVEIGGTEHYSTPLIAVAHLWLALNEKV